uniref:Monocyte to macrophage differentiation associated n=1 Tax=Oryctolagus cuniculus TaxID=9986 RepID=A0A5F9C3S8_RABIT|nr:monocyte to macrophage differentiation factor isoform X1 [Oryctolagus cuniculus]
MRFKNRFQRFMNHRAPANGRYKPTCYEHAANCYTHAFLIVPAIVGSALLHRLSDDCWEKITAWIYGMGLCALFIVSTVFHIVSWKKSHLRTVEHCFHMCDRMVIYFFIAASYAPWLNLRELGPLASHMRWFIWLMAAGGTIYVFLYHEKYKVVELFFYLTMGFSPALVVTSMALYQALQDEKKSDTVFWTHILMDSKPRGRGSSCSSPSSITFPSQKVLLMVTKEPPLDHEGNISVTITQVFSKYAQRDVQGEDFQRGN